MLLPSVGTLAKCRNYSCTLGALRTLVKCRNYSCTLGALRTLAKCRNYSCTLGALRTLAKCRNYSYTLGGSYGVGTIPALWALQEHWPSVGTIPTLGIGWFLHFGWCRNYSCTLASLWVTTQSATTQSAGTVPTLEEPPKVQE